MIDTTKFFFNKNQHVALAESANELATSKNVSVSRWQNNSKGRQIVTYIVHTGERNDFASKQENVLFSINEDSGRGGKIYDESAMLNAVIAYLHTIEIETINSDEYEVVGEGHEHYTGSYVEIIAQAHELAQYFSESDDKDYEVTERAGKIFIGDQLFAEEIAILS